MPSTPFAAHAARSPAVRRAEPGRTSRDPEAWRDASARQEPTGGSRRTRAANESDSQQSVAPPGPAEAARLCEIVRATVEATADLEPRAVRRLIEGTPRGLQHRRQIGMYVAHVGFGVRTADVARCFGRDTTTAYHAYRQVEDMRDDEAVDGFLDAIEAIVTSVHELATDRAPLEGDRA